MLMLNGRLMSQRIRKRDYIVEEREHLTKPRLLMAGSGPHSGLQPSTSPHVEHGARITKRALVTDAGHVKEWNRTGWMEAVRRAQTVKKEGL